MPSKILAVEFIKHRKGLLPAVLLGYIMVTFVLALYLPRLQQPGQFVVLVKLFMGLFSPLLMSISIIQTVHYGRKLYDYNSSEKCLLYMG